MQTEKKPKRKPFGDLYNELVLTQKKLKEIELPGTICPRETEIVQDLFGWKIIFGKHQIDCDTELQARFLQIFTELGWRTIKMPTDEKHLAKILPEIEALKNRADRVYFEREKTIFSRKLRNEVKFKLYRNLSGTYEELLAQKAKEKPRRSAKRMT